MVKFSVKIENSFKFRTYNNPKWAEFNTYVDPAIDAYINIMREMR